jgi:hypothetical protein
MNIEVLDPFQNSIANDVVMQHIPKNCSRSEFRTIKATTASSTSAQISIIPPSNTHLMDKRIYVQVQLKVTGTDLKGAPRAHILNSGLIQQSNITINGGGSFTTQNADTVFGLKRYLGTDGEFTELYETPTQLDSHYDLKQLPPFQPYQCVLSANIAELKPSVSLTATRNGGTRAADAATAQSYAVDNPASPFLETAYAGATPWACQGRDVQVSRGLYPYGGAANARLYTFMEPLFNSALADADDTSAFTNISRMDINLIFNTEVQRMWSNCFDVTAAVEVLNVSAVVRFMTPTIEQIPSVLRTNFKQYQVFKVDSSPVNTGTCTVNLNNVILQCVPSHFYLFARAKVTNLTVTMGETFLRMDSLSITLNNNFGLMSGTDTRGLYLISRQNGLKSINYTQWDGYIGSVVCLTAADLGLREGENVQLSLSLTSGFTDLSATAGRVYEFNLVTATDGILNLSPDSCVSQLGWGQQDLMNLQADESATEIALEPVQESGSGFHSHGKGGKINWKKVWRGVKRFVSSIPRVINTVAGTVGKVASFIPHPAAQILSTGLNTANGVVQNIANQTRMLTNGGVPPSVQAALPEAVAGSGYPRRKGRGLLLA